jgi:hypothetical protein
MGTGTAQVAGVSANRPTLTYAVTVSLSAVLLFQIQPMIAKAILPRFGGAAAVWTACILFFQILLLLGYVYAHWLIKRLGLKWQLIVHMGVILASFLALPVTPDPRFHAGENASALSSLLQLLLATVGAPYFVLSTTSPLVQAWLARASKTAEPYRLFATSNIASLIGLMAYPFAVEPLVNSRTQLLGWSAAYVLFAVAVIATAAQVWRQTRQGERSDDRQESKTESIGLQRWILWVSLPACSTALLLSATNYLCQDVAPVPFLWLLPLTCYLATFVLCFGQENWYRPGLFRWLLVPIFAAFFFTADARIHSHIAYTVLLAVGVVCFGCIFCHGEMVRLKPEPRSLTSFYFALSLGGAIGGIFVTVVAPLIYPSYVEIYVSILACAFLASGVAYGGESNKVVAAVTSIVIVLIVVAFAVLTSSSTDLIRTRNFYGALRIEERKTDWGRQRTLIHGRTLHGTQFLTPDGFRRPAAYYGPESGIGRALVELPRAPRRIGIVGLGTGALAGYAANGDYLRIYEINPEVSLIASTYFDYLPRCQGRYDVVLGDARLSLEREERQDFDVLVLDAFSGDSVPVHLLTFEAFQVYFKHLKSDGVLAVHVSNEYLDLGPVVKASVERQTGKQLRILSSTGDEKLGTTPAHWVIVTSNRAITESPMWRQGIPLSRQLRPWTDDYSNLLRIVRW